MKNRIWECGICNIRDIPLLFVEYRNDKSGPCCTKCYEKYSTGNDAWEVNFNYSETVN